MRHHDQYVLQHEGTGKSVVCVRVLACTVESRRAGREARRQAGRETGGEGGKEAGGKGGRRGGGRQAGRGGRWGGREAGGEGRRVHALG